MNRDELVGEGVPTGQEPTDLVAPSLEPYEKPGIAVLGTFLELTRGGTVADSSDINTVKS